MKKFNIVFLNKQIYVYIVYASISINNVLIKECVLQSIILCKEKKEKKQNIIQRLVYQNLYEDLLKSFCQWPNIGIYQFIYVNIIVLFLPVCTPVIFGCLLIRYIFREFQTVLFI